MVSISHVAVSMVSLSQPHGRLKILDNPAFHFGMHYTLTIIICLNNMENDIIPGVAPILVRVDKLAPRSAKNFKQSSFPSWDAPFAHNHHLDKYQE